MDVLVVEDNRADFALVTRQLARDGLDAVCRQVDSLEALSQTLDRDRYDAVLCDYNLPGLEFTDVLALVRARLPHTPVILVSGTVGEERAVELLRLGATDFVLKDHLSRLAPSLKRAFDEAAARMARAAAEDALRTLSRAIEQSPVSVVITDPEGAIQYVNPRFVEACGYSLCELIGRNPRVLKSGLMPQSTYQDLWRTITAGGVWEGELQNRRKSGETYWEHARISPVRSPEGRVQHFLAVKEDITARRKGEADLREATRLYAILSGTDRAVLTASSPEELFDAACRICVDNGFRMAWVGRIGADGRIRPVAAAGYGTDYLDGLVITAIPGDPWATGPSGRAALTGRPASNNDFENDPGVAPWRERGRTYGWRATSAVPFFEQGGTAGVLTFYSDEPNFFRGARETLLEDLSRSISQGLERIAMERQRQALQASLQSSEARFSTIFQASPVAIVITSLADGRIVDVNAAFSRGFGHARAEVEGRTPAEIGLWADPAPETAPGDLRPADGGAVRLRTRAGEIREGLVATEDMEVEGVAYRLTMLSDVTEHRRAERALVQAEMEKVHAMRLGMLGEIASVIAHEVNQPIGAAANYLQAAMAAPAGPAQTALLDMVLGQLSRAVATVKRVREFAADRGVDRTRAVGLAPLVDEGCALALLGAAGQGIALSVTVPDTLPPVVGDPVQIQQVVTNLVRNAAEAVQGCPRRQVAVSAVHHGDVVEVRVCDSGPGVPAGVRARLFTPFTTSKPDGTGLGLSTSRSIILSHGGDMWFEDPEDGGASFRFTLPVAPPATGDDDG